MTDTAQVADATPIVESNQEPAQAPEPIHSEMASVKEVGNERREAEQATKEAAEKEAKKQEEKPDRSKNSREALKKASEKLKAEAKDKSKDAELEAKPEPDAKKQSDQDDKQAKVNEKATDQPDEQDKQAKNDAETDQGKQEPENTSKDPKAKQTGFAEAPRRFSEDAKAAWETAPEAVKAEIHRAVEEMEGGIQQYQEAFEVLKPYEQLAQQHGTTIPQALENYTNIERTLLQDPLRGLQMVADYAGLNLREVAGQILNQTPEQIQGDQDKTIRELRSELIDLKQQVGGVSSHIHQQHISSLENSVQEFADNHPRFEELADDIKLALEIGKAATLPDAYAFAERINPASSPASEPENILDIEKPDLAQTRRASKSISGAPSGGSSPAIKREPSKTTREALHKAMNAQRFK